MSAIPTVAIVESEMSLHAGHAKKLLRGQIIIAKVTLERASLVATHTHIEGALCKINTTFQWLYNVEILDLYIIILY